MTLKIQLGD